MSGIRVLFLTGGRRVGGMELHVLRLAASLPRNAFECVVGCLHPSPQYLEMLGAAGVRGVDLRFPTLTGPGALFRYVALERFVRRFRPHILHTYGFTADVVGGMLRATRPGLRFMTSRRSEDPSRRHQQIRRLSNRWAQKIVCVSSETATFVRKTENPPDRLIEVIPNGVQPRAARPASSGLPAVRFGTLGNLLPVKGTDLLVDAFLRFDRDLPVELVIAGLVDRPWAQELRDRASVDPRIRFIGRTSEPEAFLAQLDAFVLPSRSEGMSNSLLEAMALGLPSIATDVGSNRSLLHPASEPPGGIVCAPAAEALYDALQTLARDPAARSAYGDAALAIVTRHYSFDLMIRRYDDLYRAVLTTGQAGSRVLPTCL